MDLPSELKYTNEHEWIRIEGEAVVVGITDFAQQELGEVVFVDLPQVGQQVEKGNTLCVLESTKAASDVYAPVSGTVKEVNNALESNPEKVNQEPYASGWLVTLEGISEGELASLMDATQYTSFIEQK